MRMGERQQAIARLSIERLGARGEGIATHDGGRIYVPYALAGETVTADVAGERGTLVGLVEASPDRIVPICPHFGTCGGCAVQELALPRYADWKRGLLVAALARAGVEADVAPLVDAHGAGRRRATFHARTEPDGTTRVGFMRARSHDIVAIEACPILDPRLAGALPAARAIAASLAPARKPLDIVATATQAGIDVDLRGHGPLDERARGRLAEVVLAHDLARLANHGVIVIENRKPVITFGPARVALPSGAFLQATTAGEETLAAYVLDAVAGARRVADLFCGVGTFALRLGGAAEVTAIDLDGPWLPALERAARETVGLRRISIEARDLFKRPLAGDALDRHDAVVMDPPRAGAEAQAHALVASSITRVVSIACDVDSLARDAAILIAGGFEVGRIVPVDQFRYSPHLEIVATFSRRPKRPKRRLLG
ncbi:putative enzyme [Beijerinckiaceae bacterium RH CH11]|nr:putative enzyme [Beijerinckiaceae bacterium RH CH11]VVB45854.1 putative enzyme [Beijerinckiaceae bacterium RH AL8]